MKIVRLDIVFDGKPRIQVARDVGPAHAPAAPTSAGTVFRHAGILPIEWIHDHAPCHVVVDLAETGHVTAPVVISPKMLEGTGEFGNLLPQTVPLSDLRTGRCTVRFPLTVAHLPANGVRECFVQWDWRVSVGAADSSLGVSDHLLFVTLAPPTKPWSLPTQSTMPFALALRTACKFARGATEERSAVSQLLVAVRQLGDASPPVQYGPDVSDYTFRGPTSPQFFECHRLLTNLAVPPDSDPIVLSCAEFSCLMVALANIVGCATTRVTLQLGRDCHTFDTLPIRQLGLGQRAPRSFAFIRHEICVIPHATRSKSLVYDPPFLLRTGNGHGGAPSLEPVNGMPLGSITSSIHDGVYLSHLVAANDLPVMDVFEPLQFLFEAPFPTPPPVACIAHRFRNVVNDLTVAVLPPKPLIERFRLSGLVPMPTKEQPPKDGTPQRRIFYKRPGDSRPLVQVDVWTSGDQKALIDLFADYAARSEVDYRRIDGGDIPTYVSSSGYAAILLFKGGVVRVVRLSDAAPLTEVLTKEAAEMNSI